MADDKSKQPIIIKKKKGGHAGAHGGAWKIAYADFVTAMMAFFMVMWIIGMDVQTKQGIAAYFQNLSARARNEPASPHIIHLEGAPPVKKQPEPIIPHDNNLDKVNAEKIKSQINSMLSANPQTERLHQNVVMDIGDKEMRIELLEGGDNTFFEGNGKDLKPDAKRVVDGIGAILARNRHLMTIEGHTDNRSIANRPNGRWELSCERANAVRAALANASVDDERILAVIGLADTHLRLVKDPPNPSNRRVTIVIPFDLAEDRLTE